MLIYLVDNVKPKIAFSSEQAAIEYALEKAKKRRCTNVWLGWEDTYQKACVNKEVNGESHIHIEKIELI